MARSRVRLLKSKPCIPFKNEKGGYARTFKVTQWYTTGPLDRHMTKGVEGRGWKRFGGVVVALVRRTASLEPSTGSRGWVQSWG